MVPQKKGVGMFPIEKKLQDVAARPKAHLVDVAALAIAGLKWVSERDCPCAERAKKILNLEVGVGGENGIGPEEEGGVQGSQTEG